MPKGYKIKEEVNNAYREYKNEMLKSVSRVFTALGYKICEDGKGESSENTKNHNLRENNESEVIYEHRYASYDFQR